VHPASPNLQHRLNPSILFISKVNSPNGVRAVTVNQRRKFVCGELAFDMYLQIKGGEEMQAMILVWSTSGCKELVWEIFVRCHLEIDCIHYIVISTSVNCDCDAE
jgi:hypothetical protein